MIHLVRGPVPEFFLTPRAGVLRSQAAEFFGRSQAERGQLRFDFQRVAGQMYPAVRRALQERFGGKCAYCETLVERPDIEAFRPKQRATNLDGKVDDLHYWWMTFEWSNYLPACRECNTLKGPRFPVKGGRAQVGATGVQLAAEHRLLLDPSEDDPQKVLLFLEDGRVTSEDERGSVTIDVIGLNRDSLVAARRVDLQMLLKLLANIRSAQVNRRVVGDLLDMTASSSPFAGMRRQFVRAWAMEIIRQRPAAKELLGTLLGTETALGERGLRDSRETMKRAGSGLTDRTRASERFSIQSRRVSTDFYRKAQFIEKIELRNIRAFEHLELSPPIGSGGAAKWYMLLGENGTGKSTILQSIACALAGQQAVKRLKLKASNLLRRDCKTGEVRVHLTGMSSPIVMTLRRSKDQIVVTPAEPKVMVLGYGATRLMEPEDQGVEHASRVKIENLFRPFAQLSNGRPWLYDAPPERFDRFARVLAGLLPRSDGARIERVDGVIRVKGPGVDDTLTELSSGYQAVISLALDIMSVMRLGWEDMDSAEGIVLIDEVDAHLHPRWKMRIVKRLSEVFPRLQFIATSHEPLTLRGLDKDAVAILSRGLDGRVGAVTSLTDDLPSPKVMRVEQLLASEYFGLHTTEDLEIDSLFEEYYTLLAMRSPSRSPAQEERLLELRERLGTERRMGLTPREQLVFAAADDFLADRARESDAMPAKRKKAARARLKELWARVSPPATKDSGKGGSR